jgi:endogenous inhibitor of DNA gyrase (YacG/DUF329 family)
MSEYKRNCPNCGKELFYKSNSSFWLANKKNNKCIACANKLGKLKEKKVEFNRNCPICNTKLFYSSEEGLQSAIKNNNLCKVCAKKESNIGKSNPMQGRNFYDVWLEKYGKEEADKKQKQWQENICKRKNKGKDNPNYGGKYSRFEGAIKWCQENQKGKKFEEIYGEERAKEIKRKLSNASSGSNNPMYGKEAPNGSGNGWSGHYKGHYFRSMLELYYLIYLIDNDINFEKGEQKKFYVPYKFDNINKTYRPDYYLIDNDEVIEIKPSALLNIKINKLKFEAARQKYGDKFKILTEKEIVKIELDYLYNLYIDKIIVFDKGYDVKFENYYNKYKRGRI